MVLKRIFRTDGNDVQYLDDWFCYEMLIRIDFCMICDMSYIGRDAHPGSPKLNCLYLRMILMNF